MGQQRYGSWGRYPLIRQQGCVLPWRSDPLPEPLPGTASLLPYGAGRSYGDVCLNRGGTVVATDQLNHFIEFDTESGLLRCESGVRLQTLLELIVPAGWFLSVAPGTALATVGGAVANDVHGKNHHQAGTFGRHVRAFELARSDGSRCVCSPTAEPELFAATIGGLGLTGLVTWVELQLREVGGPLLDEESIKFAQVDEFFRMSDSSADDFEYTVAWVDCLARGAALGRGLFARANHSATPARPVSGKPRFSVPFTPPFSLVNKLTLRPFNALWYARQRAKRVRRTVPYRNYFFPLDSIGHWNRMYGPKGMLQYQCVLPGDDGRNALKKMLGAIARSGQGSFLAVVKDFGALESPGMLSFPRPGVTLALDFPMGKQVMPLLNSLDAMTLEVGGAVYPAKDARMSGATFRAGFPAWEDFARFIDPAFSSSFWRRVAGDSLD